MGGWVGEWVGGWVGIYMILPPPPLVVGLARTTVMYRLGSGASGEGVWVGGWVGLR